MVARDNISESGLDDFIRSHPGLYWQIGNEPNVPNQDNLSPADYAQRYNYWYRRIKGLDPSAKLLNGGIVNWPDVMGYYGWAVAYINDFRESYRAMYGEYPPVDVWSIHAFPPFYVNDDGWLTSYCETAELKRFIAEAVQYLRSAGESQPIWLTEFGINHRDDADPCMVPFMTDIVHWLEESQLVDRWYWFSLNSGSGNHSGNLVTPSGDLTVLGGTYRDLISEGRRP